MKDALHVRPVFDQNHDSLPVGAVLHPIIHHRAATVVAVHDSEPAQEDRATLSEFAVWMIFLAYLAVILIVIYLLRAQFASS